MKRIYKIIFAATIYIIVCVENTGAQSIFNKLVDYNRNESHILVSLTPVENGYITVCGTGNEELFGNMRCSLVTRFDTLGNVLYHSFVGDPATYLFEGWENQKMIKTDSETFKYVFNKENMGAYICEFNDTLGVKSYTDLYYATDSSFANENFVEFSFIDGYIYIYGEKKGDTISNDFFHGTLWKIDSLNNLVWKRNLFNDENKLNGGQVIKSFDENLMLLGRTFIDSKKQLYISKIDTAGNTLWRREYGRQGWNNGTKWFFTQSPDSCYVISGVYPVCYRDRYMEVPSYASCFRKIDDNGELVWEKIIENFYKTGYVGIHSQESNYDLYVDSDGYIYAISTGVAAQGQSLKGTLTKLSPKGEIMYRRYYHPLGRNATGSMYLGSISPTPDGGFVMGGYTDYNEEIDEMFNGYYQQPWIVKTDHEGLDGLCYTELPELDFDVFIPDTVCNLDTLDCIVNISGPSAPYTLEFSTGQVIDSIYYPDVFVPKEIGIDTEIVGNDNMLYQYSEVITEATLKDTIKENIIAKHYDIATPTYSGEQQLAITLTDFYGNTKTITKNLYVNHCNEVEVDENENIVLSVYPNPATECINIAGENITGIEICNLLGGVVYETQLCNGNNVISTDGMGAGSYFVRVRMVDGKVVTKKILVVK
ncbi:MAG: T9SS type A sorting domain-containing protein [Bacteroidales bacterium]|nr:T9SS type A sorting domain-containing protein [Bacteroidales bacterium]